MEDYIITGENNMTTYDLGKVVGSDGAKGDTGEKGSKGDKGDKGDAFTYADFTPEQLEGLKGPKGDTGNTGATGATGNGISSISKTGSSGLVDTYTILFTNGNSTTFTVTNGADGSVPIVTAWESTLSDSKVASEKLTKNGLDSKVNTSDIVDNLTTSDATKVLSAKQGKALNDLIGNAIAYINQ